MTGTRPSGTRETEIANRSATPPRKSLALRRSSRSGRRRRAYPRYAPVAWMSNDWAGVSYTFLSTWYAAQGVTVNATTSDVSIATGTMNAIGPMYSPIIPVMKNIGRNATITVNVARIVGGRISSTAMSVASFGGCPRNLKWR